VAIALAYLAWNRARRRPLLSDEEVISTVHSIERTKAGHSSGAGEGGECR